MGRQSHTVAGRPPGTETGCRRRRRHPRRSRRRRYRFHRRRRTRRRRTSHHRRRLRPRTRCGLRLRLRRFRRHRRSSLRRHRGRLRRRRRRRRRPRPGRRHQELDRVREDLRRVPVLAAVLVLPFPGPDLPLDVDLAALPEEPRDVLRDLAEAGHAVPLGVVGPVAGVLVLLPLGGREPQGGHDHAPAGRAGLGIRTEVADEDHLVDGHPLSPCAAAPGSGSRIWGSHRRLGGTPTRNARRGTAADRFRACSRPGSVGRRTVTTRGGERKYALP